jgi:ADP-ribose pyrophosphatase
VAYSFGHVRSSFLDAISTEHKYAGIPLKLGWSVKRSRVAYSGRFPVIEDVLVADLDGRETLYTYLGMDSRAVSILAHDGRGSILTVREYRHPIGRVITDLPIGSVHPDESSREAARRELREETGYDAGELVHFGTVFPLPALALLALDYYFATDLTRVQADPDATEILEAEWMVFDEVLAKVMAGELQHGSLPHAAVLATQKGLVQPSSSRGPRG